MVDEERYRYREIARRIAEDIEAGLYREGDRLPSVRRLRETHAVSATTAMRVLVELEQDGRVEARPRSGFYVRPRVSTAASDAPAATRTTVPPGPTAVDALIRRIFRAHGDAGAKRRLLPLGAAEIDEALLPHKDLAAAVTRALREGGPRLLAYGHGAGDPELRRRLALLLGERGTTVGPDDIVVTAGETDALGLALMATTVRGDTVAVESPCFFGILQWIEALGLRAVEIATDPVTGLDLDELERVAAAMPVAALALNPTFHNPFGFAMPSERMTRLLAIAERLDLPIIEDDVYGELHYGNRPRRPLKSFDAQGRVLYCSSFSKTLAPGFRIGWCVPGRYAEAFEHARAPRTAGVATLTQAALARHLDGRAHRRHLDHLRRLFAAQAGPVRALVRESFPAGTRISDPAGGFVFWVEVPPPFDALRFHEIALAEGISTAPGPIFSATGGFRNAFRLSVGRRLTDEVTAGIRRLGAIARVLVETGPDTASETEGAVKATRVNARTR